MLYEVSMLEFKMATACHFVAGPVHNPFILQPFVAFAVLGLLLTVLWALLIADSTFASFDLLPPMTLADVG